MIADANIDDLEIVLDMLGCESMRKVFLGELADRRSDRIEALIDKGSDEERFKIQMIDEVFEIREEIISELKSRKNGTD